MDGGEHTRCARGALRGALRERGRAAHHGGACPPRALLCEGGSPLLHDSAAPRTCFRWSIADKTQKNLRAATNLASCTDSKGTARKPGVVSRPAKHIRRNADSRWAASTSAATRTCRAGSSASCAACSASRARGRTRSSKPPPPASALWTCAVIRRRAKSSSFRAQVGRV